MTEPDDIIDLTESSPINDKDTKKRPREDDNEEVIDLEEMNRQRIMSFARNISSRPLPRPVVPTTNHPSTSEAATTMSPSGNNAAIYDEEASRKRIMDFARNVNNTSTNPPTSTTDNNNNSLLAQLHAERMARNPTTQKSNNDKNTTINTQKKSTNNNSTTSTSINVASSSQPHTITTTTTPSLNNNNAAKEHLSILSWNIWFREDVAGAIRLTAIINIIQQKNPDIICLQEVTPAMYQYLRSSAPWWRRYEVRPEPADAMDASYYTALLWKKDDKGIVGGTYARMPFQESIMGRDLKALTFKATLLGNSRNSRNSGNANTTNNNNISKTVHMSVCTTHLESPTGRNQLFSQPRQAQCKAALGILHSMKHREVVFIGDMNWSEKNDGQIITLPNTSGWFDAWPSVHPNDPGYTYDQGTNRMLRKGGLRLRLDRALCRLEDCVLESIEMVGREAIPDVQHERRPVLPSDHYGLFMKLRLKDS